MSIQNILDVEFGTELPVFEPDTTLANVRRIRSSSGLGRTTI